MILQETVERRIVNAGGICYYHDVPLGVYVLRGDSMVLMGQLNEMQERAVMREISLDELERMEQAETREKPLVWDFDNDLVA
jgi:U6 snRNA-associated Sm-like protein LSm1